MGGCGVRKEASTLENCIQYRKGKTIYKEKHPQVIYTGMEKDETYPIGHTGPICHMRETLGQIIKYQNKNHHNQVKQLGDG